MGNVEVQWFIEGLAGQSLGRQSRFSWHMAEQARAQQVDGELRLVFAKGNVDIYFVPGSRAS